MGFDRDLELMDIVKGIGYVFLITVIIGMLDINSGQSSPTPVNYIEPKNTNYGNDNNIEPVSTVIEPTPVITPVVIPKPTPDIMFDVDIDTKALLYRKGDCAILIKEPKDIGNKDTEAGNCTVVDWENVQKKMAIEPVATVVPTIVPTVVPTVTAIRRLTISELDSIFQSLSQKGWESQLYERNEFDCSRMSSYWQIILEKDYGVESNIYESRIRSHAWVAARVSDFEGEKDSTYPIWTDSSGVEWYYIESTAPKVVRYDNWDVNEPAVDFYSPNDVRNLGNYVGAVKYSRTEFELTNDDIQKITNFMNQ